MEQNTTIPNRTYKARIFEMIFSQKSECLSLYNAVNQTHYTDPELLEINTLENAIYMSMKNDVSFVIDSRLSLYEHQSTTNPNLPLRFLIYVANLYSNMVKDESLYGERLIPLPIGQAVEEAIDSCIREGILAEFLKKNRAEAISMSIFEYDEEKHMQQEREENLERGKIINLLQNINGLMETMGWSAEEAMDHMKVPASEREAVKPLL